MEAIKNGKAFIIVIGLLCVIILVLLIARYTAQNKPQNSEKLTNSATSQENISSIPSRSGNQLVSPVPMPTMIIEKYQLQTNLPAVPVAARMYSVKTNYSLDEVEDIANRFGLNTVEALTDNRYVTAYNFSSTGKKGYLVFDTVTGSFSFESYDVLKPIENFNEASALQYGQTLLKEIGMEDGTISCTTTYEVKGLPNRKFIECHRDTEKNGLPILGFPGIMNVPLDKSLSSLITGQNVENAPEDPRIINTSDNSDGKSRPSDFNTITFGVSKLDGRIITIDSNIRTIENARLLTSADLLTPREALDVFAAHKAETGFILPEGQGALDFSKVYPDGTARAQTAEITDYVLVYPEKPGTLQQDTFVPYYLVRGTTRLDSGYETRFVQLVPAMRQQLSFLPTKTSNVAGIFAQNIGSDKTQKQGGFKVESPTEPVSPIPTNPPVPTETNQCLLATTGGYEFSVTLPGLGTITVTTEGAGRLGVGNFRTLHVKSSSFPLQSIAAVREKFFAADGPVVQQYVQNIAKAYQQNAGFVPQSVSAESVLASFEQINSVNKFYFCDSPYADNHIAPPVNCDPAGIEVDREGNRSGSVLETGKIQSVAQTVAAQVATGIQNNSLQIFAQRADIFPEETRRTMSWVFITNTDKAHSNSCYLTGESPHILLYSEHEKEVTVKVGGEVTYVYPAYNESDSWNIKADRTGGAVYYEYVPKTVKQSNEGWVIKKDNLKAWISTFANSLALNKKEEQLLTEDLNKTLHSINTEYVELSLIDKKYLDEQVPLSFSINPDRVYRFQLVVQPLEKNRVIKSPILKPLDRSGFTVVELGAILAQ